MAWRKQDGLTRRAAATRILGVAFFGFAPSRLIAQVSTARFSVLLPDRNNPYVSLIQEGIADYVKKASSEGRPIELTTEDFKYELDLAASLVEQFVSLKVDALLALVPPGLVDGLAPIFAKAMAAGVPVIAIGQEVPKVTASIVPDLSAAGELQAQIAVSLAGGEGTIIHIAGLQGGNDPALLSGFSRAIEKTKFKIIEAKRESFDYKEALAASEGELKKYSQVDVIVAESDLWARAAAEALKAAGRQAIVIGLGATPDGLAAIHDQLIAATVDLRPRAQGFAAAEAADVAHTSGLCRNKQKPPCPPDKVAPAAVIAKKG